MFLDMFYFKLPNNYTCLWPCIIIPKVFFKKCCTYDVQNCVIYQFCSPRFKQSPPLKSLYYPLFLIGNLRAELFGTKCVNLKISCISGMSFRKFEIKLVILFCLGTEIFTCLNKFPPSNASII